MAIKRDYRDESGIMRRVLIPNEDSNPAEGVPLSVDVGQLYQDVPHDFVVRLSNALFDRGLIEPSDFLRPGGHELTRDAFLDCVRQDALSIISLAKSMIGN